MKFTNPSRWRIVTSQARILSRGVQNLRSISHGTFPDRAVQVLDVFQIVDTQSLTLKNTVVMEEGTLNLHGHIMPSDSPCSYDVAFLSADVCGLNGECITKEIIPTCRERIQICFQCPQAKIEKSPSGFTVMAKDE
jgi:hypothetical protein